MQVSSYKSWVLYTPYTLLKIEVRSRSKVIWIGVL